MGYNPQIMTIPEQGSPEMEAARERIYEEIMIISSNVAVRRKNLPPVVHVLIRDEVIGEKVAAFLNIRYIGNSGKVYMAIASAVILPSEETVIQAADILLKSRPGIPMICDKEITDELSKNSVVWREEDHYKLVGRPDGVLEIYTPYDVTRSPQTNLPPGASIQRWTE